MASGEELAARARRGAVDFTALLPTSILAYIFSFLPLRTALLCGAVSRPWLAARGEMLSRAVEFDFGPDFSAWMLPEQYAGAVDLALAAHEAPTLDRISIFFNPVMSYGVESRVKSWLEFAASKQVRSMEMVGCVLPGSVFNSRSLTSLSLSDCSFYPPLELLELPSLRMLSLRRVDVVVDETIAGLLSSCLHLESLSLTLCFHIFSLKILSPPRLRSLTIVSCPGLHELEIDAPVLKSFHLSNYVGDVVMKNVSGLDDAYIHMPGWSTDPELFWRFASAFKNVTSLTLRDDHLMDISTQIEVLVDLANEMPLTFRNLRNLHLYFESDQILLLLWSLFLACNFPAIEILVIDCLFQQLDCFTQHDMEGYSFTLVEPKVVIVKGLVGFKDQMTVAGAILTRACHLETLVVVMSKMEITIHSEDELAAHRYQLEALPKVSKNARILLCGIDDDLATMALPASPHAEVHQEAVRAELMLQH